MTTTTITAPTTVSDAPTGAPESKWQENVRKARERAAQRDGITVEAFNAKHPRRERAIEHAEHPDAAAHRERAAARRAARDQARDRKQAQKDKRKRFSLFG